MIRRAAVWRIARGRAAESPWWAEVGEPKPGESRVHRAINEDAEGWEFKRFPTHAEALAWALERVGLASHPEDCDCDRGLDARGPASSDDAGHAAAGRGHGAVGQNRGHRARGSRGGAVKLYEYRAHNEEWQQIRAREVEFTPAHVVFKRSGVVVLAVGVELAYEIRLVEVREWQ